MVRSSSLGAKAVQSFAPEFRLEKLTYRSAAEAKAAKQKFEQSSATAYVEYDTPIQAFGADAFKKHQWSLAEHWAEKRVKRSGHRSDGDAKTDCEEETVNDTRRCHRFR